MTPFFQCDCW